MVYFIAWVVFLVVVILAIPIAAFLSNRQERGPSPKRSRKEVPAADVPAQPEEQAFGENEGFVAAEEPVGVENGGDGGFGGGEFGGESFGSDPTAARDDGFDTFDEFK